MCFSAGASFAGGAVLSAIGYATVRESHKPSQKLFATIPLLFAFQQFSEGIIWITLRQGGYDTLQSAATYFFLMMALIAWPMLIPLATYKMEEDIKKKRILKFLTITGILLSAYYSVCLINLEVYPQINQFHIQYINNFPKEIGLLAFGIYAIVTLVPLFISSVKRMNLFGALSFFSCLLTGVFYKEYLTSVWCFFAAIISAVVYLIIKESNEEFNLSGLKIRRWNF